MPVRNSKKKIFGHCDCCDSKTAKITGSVFLEDKGETLYLARWTVGQRKHGIAFLILVPSQNVFISIVYSFEENSFMVVGPNDQDWQPMNAPMRILNREEVIGTRLAEWAFSFIDEIWTNDRHLIKFYHKMTIK
ncbi:hypothetical protein [Roseibacillus ishigakijimensis]|uniref:hypothetical protein n=1 Tax=Roseibacillus ishigakijimensis TaxID=454146 RepID=UPI001904E1BC|nr:hypothetical protein [Roseibacillus ishigakijimensis]